ncbi:AbrB/MazE/SpoVT family DNA-binding domain-containing protein [Deinococcus sp.]|uniref:AbrB/MazE/SpoVT family DNA-binding domain-containing protein n=1 Tax=Deinococcus sp. TaxID=47478 RepID=UPI003B590DE7
MTQQPRLDKFGRVLIPKKLREELGLRVGEALSLEVDGDGLHLRPVVREARLVRHNGRLILDRPGLAVSSQATNEQIEAARQNRDAAVLE